MTIVAAGGELIIALLECEEILILSGLPGTLQEQIDQSRDQLTGVITISMQF